MVGISNWISECARRSEVFRGCNVSTISNAIDTEQFYPVEPQWARKILNLPHDKKIVLVGAKDVDDFYKGFDLFVESMRSIGADDIHLVVFGKVRCEALSTLGVKFTSLGFLTDSVSLRLAYSAADVFVAPSKMESFGKTLAEAMACGTPVVCFDSTGPKDIVEHKVTGYKAEPYDSADLARGIQWVLALPEQKNVEVRTQSRDRVERLFDSEVVARQYLNLYEKSMPSAS